MIARAPIAALVALSLLDCKPRPSPGAGSARPVAIRRGDLAERVRLTGDLDAVTSENLVVPRTPTGDLSVRWLEADGTLVTAGQKVAELDNSAFAKNLEDQKLSAAQSQNDLKHQIAQNAILTADKQFEVDKARIALTKARGEASVAPDTLPRRVFQQKQVEVQRAEAALAKATDELAAHDTSAALDVKVRSIAIEKGQREIEAAEKAIESVVLRAPRDGVVVISDHPWFGRKIELGDNVWVGLSIVRLPDLRSIKVNAMLSDVDDGRIAVGMSATTFVDAYPNLPLPGTITEISPVAREPAQQSLRRSFLVTVTLSRTDPRLLPGMSVRVDVSGKKMEGALLVPRASVDPSATPPRLRLGDGSTAPLGALLCDPQQCAIVPATEAANTVREGVFVKPFAAEGT